MWKPPETNKKEWEVTGEQTGNTSFPSEAPQLILSPRLEGEGVAQLPLQRAFCPQFEASAAGQIPRLMLLWASADAGPQGAGERGAPGAQRSRTSLGCCAGTGKPGMGEASAPPPHTPQSSRKVQSKRKYFPSNTGNPQSLLCFPSQLCEIISCNLAITLNFSSFYCVGS